ncbi:MAG: prenyltransferase [Chloroflexi bacterium]|jgi:1,4-dihydroxy-2-naphthoate polyprenyltransferase|nr:prenyltransferase [Chloroflexota bacterium]
MSTAKIWIAETRPQFLILTPICVFVGIAASLYDGISFHGLYFALALIGAICAHITVNVLNDYFDYKTGVDLKTTRTPFSGGSGILPSAAMKPNEVMLLGMVSLAIVIGIGTYFITVYGVDILPIGIAGVICASLYTPLIMRLPGASEIAAGAGFAFITLGTYFTQDGTYSSASAVVSTVTFLLVANLLLINEIPDTEADRLGKRKHIPIVLGTQAAARIYALINILAYITIIAGVISQAIPALALLGLLTIPLAIKAMKGAVKNHNDIENLVPSLGANILVVLVTPLLMSIGITIWAYID